jgi:hypothetical protein
MGGLSQNQGNDPNIRTLAALFCLSCSDVRIGWQEPRECVFELRAAVTVSGQLGALGRVQDDRGDFVLLQQHGELPLRNRGATAAELTPFGAQVGSEPLYDFGRWNLIAIGE